MKIGFKNTFEVIIDSIISRLSNIMQVKKWENLYGEFDKTNYEKFTIKKLPNVSTFYHGEIIKWAKEVRAKRTLIAGEDKDIKKYLQDKIGTKELHTTGLSNADYRWDFENDPPKMGQFDLIISQAMIEHLLNPYKHIEDLANLLIPGGFLIIHTVCPGFPYHRYPIDTCRFFPDWFEEITSPKRLNLTIIKKRIKIAHIFYMYKKTLKK